MKRLLASVGDRSDQFAAMLDALGDRLALCPASAKAEFHNAFPGGLVEHSLRVLTIASKWLPQSRDVLSTKIPKESLIVSCLFHDLGKMGSVEHDYYLAQTDDWRREKRGELYAYNDKMTYMSVPQRGLWLLQHFGVRLTEDEYLAILLNDGMYYEPNRPYGMREPDLAIIVHQADLLATRWEKQHPTLESRSNN